MISEKNILYVMIGTHNPTPIIKLKNWDIRLIPSLDINLITDKEYKSICLLIFMYNVHLSAVTFIKVLITFVYSVLIDKKLSFSFSYTVVIRCNSTCSWILKGIELLTLWEHNIKGIMSLILVIFFCSDIFYKLRSTLKCYWTLKGMSYWHFGNTTLKV